MLDDFLAALALVIIIEGIMPFLNPEHFRKTLLTAARMSDRDLRIIGGVCMAVGLVVLYLVRRS